MKKRTISGITAAMILSAAVLLSGCGSTAASNAVTRSATESELFTSRDLSQEADTGEAERPPDAAFGQATYEGKLDDSRQDRIAGEMSAVAGEGAGDGKRAGAFAAFSCPIVDRVDFIPDGHGSLSSKSSDTDRIRRYPCLLLS